MIIAALYTTETDRVERVYVHVSVSLNLTFNTDDYNVRISDVSQNKW
jgi:hypothetical protein